MLRVPRALSVPPLGIGVWSSTAAAPVAGHVRLRTVRLVPRTSNRAAGSTEVSTMLEPPLSKLASRTLTCRPGIGPGPVGPPSVAAGRSGRRVNRAWSDRTPRGSRSTRAQGSVTRTRSMASFVGHCASIPVTSTRSTVSSGRSRSSTASLATARLPRSVSANGSSATAVVTSASAAPRTRPAIGSHGCSMARSAARTLRAASSRRCAPSTVPRTVTSPLPTVAEISTGEVPRKGQATSPAVSAIRVISARPLLAASVSVARPSSTRSRVTWTSTATAGAAGGDEAGGEEGASASLDGNTLGWSRAVRPISPEASRSTMAVGRLSVRSATRTVAGQV